MGDWIGHLSTGNNMTLSMGAPLSHLMISQGRSFTLKGIKVEDDVISEMRR